MVPPGQTVTAAAGTGWTCTNDAAQATCRIDDADVQPGQALPKISVTADVAGPTLIAQVYVAISSDGDVNPANDEALGKVTVTPAIEGDQLFVQVAGALSMRNGGTVSSGDVSITADPAGSLGGADRLQIDATVGSTHVLADLQRTNLTLFTGTITVTDPTLQGGVPLTVDWRGPVFSNGLAPWRSLSSELLGLRIPSLDVGGVTGALANGLTYTLNFSAADYAPEAPAAGQPPLSYFANNPSNISPSLNPPSRVVSGAEVTLPVEISPRGGSTVGPVAATVDLPTGLEYVRAGKRYDLHAGSGRTGPCALHPQQQHRCITSAEPRRRPRRSGAPRFPREHRPPGAGDNTWGSSDGLGDCRLRQLGEPIHRHHHQRQSPGTRGRAHHERCRTHAPTCTSGKGPGCQPTSTTLRSTTSERQRRPPRPSRSRCPRASPTAGSPTRPSSSATTASSVAPPGRTSPAPDRTGSGSPR